jgi:hypothetical protein
VLLLVMCLTAALVTAEILLRYAASEDGPFPRALPSPLMQEGVDIAVYGDSTPFGLGAETSFPAEIARRTGLRVLNRSRPGLNSTQVARVLKEDLRFYRPRILLVMAGVNDGWNLEDVPLEMLGPAARWYRSLPALRTLRLLAIWWEVGSDGSTYRTAKVKGWSEREETARVLGNVRLRAILRGSLDSIFAMAKESDTRVLFVGYQAHGWNHVGDMAEDVARESHPESVLSTRHLFAEGEHKMIQKDEFHPTTEGQRQIATLLIAELERRGWISEGEARSAS